MPAIIESMEPLQPPVVLDKTQSLIQKACDILGIISRYRLKRSDTSSGKYHLAGLKFVALIYDQIKSSQPVRMCLPAFPFKSPNTQSKVLGRLPDMAEEFALAHINGLCAAIGDIYPAGAELTIISDGLVYNDLLGVPDKEVWAYGQGLRALAVEKRFKNIKFSRLDDLLHTNLADDLSEMAYVANATDFRRLLLNNYGKPNWDSSQEISNNEDTCLTYRGYLRFLETDLEHVYPVGPDRSKSRYKNGIKYISKQMLARGDAFARAVREHFPTHIRLSIHPSSTSQSKLSISLLPTTSVWTTPWHCSMATMMDGTVVTAPREQFDNKPDRFELVHNEHGRPSYYREKSDLLSWGDDNNNAANKIISEPLYPCGLLIRPAAGPLALSIEDVDAKRLRALSELNSPVVLRDFARTDDRELFEKTAGDLGTPLPWWFGLVLEVKDQGQDSPQGLGSTLSMEKMPFHYDGVFRTEKRVAADGMEEVVPVPPPKFQFFTAVTPSPQDTGYTMFASSSLIFRYLPPTQSLDVLKQLTFTVSTHAFQANTLSGLPLVLSHPTTGKPCLRFHEPWPRSKTNFETMDVTIKGGGIASEEESLRVSEEIVALLYDRRVTYWHSWKKGDLVVNDNVSMMHTRSEFISGSDRELWRIHFD
ncbi:putative pyoverdine/dityrosine biosynthesis protein [Podospora didyma]|uniref:Pyoverdine/dityrosine biosynthesis protein n=1 Tax=Podospora didyma TaxID=330526 RepID=A0AAE0U3K4_9PEZI|nr:putative pyoverdine/dityrosine biosynthesis protein [Podospora didyma]